ncbi:MAG: hypothetical protein JSW11_16360 [Candidatus Heimdallarchaeota archaeon]|nr:MAG: hypothetical protein JSW11_16360 [Candidatus Heimdallarchaeota archaeon]
MDNSMKAHNDSLMKNGYEILQQCKEKSIPCFLWGGGAIYHLLGGRLDYRIMSDLEFFIPKKADKAMQKVLTEMDFYPNRPFNMMQNMSRTPRREFYRPNRELSKSEIEELTQGRKNNIEEVEYQKIELFVDGIRMCWTFKFSELPPSYSETLICPPGFQIALKANAIHPDDFDLKDIQDISSILNANGQIGPKDSIFSEPKLDPHLGFSIGTEIFGLLAKSKSQFPSTMIRNFQETLKYTGPICCNEDGKGKLAKIVEFLQPLDSKKGFLAKVRMEKPERVDARHI